MNIYTPYTYLIGWSRLNKWYYGARYAQGCNPKDFWKKYFTSSTAVKDFVNKNGQPDIIQIRKTFNSDIDCIEWEGKVLKRVRAAQRDCFLNGNNARGFISYKTEEHKRKIGISNSKPKIGRALEACRNNYKIAAELRRGKKDSEETKRKRNESVRRARQAPGFKQRNKFTVYLIDDIEYIGTKSIEDKYDISRQTIINRCKNDKWNWHKIGSIIK
jgi:hypothetical protein